MLRKPCTLVKRHYDELHFIVMYNVHVYDLALHVWDKLCQFENFACFDCFIHDIVPPDFYFCVDCTGACTHTNWFIRRRQYAIAGAERLPVSVWTEDLQASISDD